MYALTNVTFHSEICTFGCNLVIASKTTKSKVKSFTVLYSLYYGTPKRGTSIRGFSLWHCAWAAQLLKKCRSGGDNMSDLTGWRVERFEPQTLRSREEYIAA